MFHLGPYCRRIAIPFMLEETIQGIAGDHRFIRRVLLGNVRGFHSLRMGSLAGDRPPGERKPTGERAREASWEGRTLVIRALFPPDGGNIALPVMDCSPSLETCKNPSR